MRTIVEQKFPFGLRQYLENDLEQIKLKIVQCIETVEINNTSPVLQVFFSGIEKTCKDKHLWVLLGSDDKKSWIPLQLASRNRYDVIGEIKTDFQCMIPFDKNVDKRTWKSYFHRDVMKIEYGKDAKCQKYGKIRELCKYLAVAILDDEESLVECEMISKYQKKECDLAKVMKPLLWNPAGKEFNYLKLLNDDSADI